MNDLPVRAARWSAHHPWRAVGFWLGFVVLCIGIGIGVGTHNATTEDYRVGEAGRAEAMAAEGGLQRQPEEQVLIDRRDGSAVGAEGQAAADEVKARMERLAEIGSRLVIAEATVKTHLLRLFAKLDVNDRTHAVVVAIDRGLLRRP